MKNALLTVEPLPHEFEKVNICGIGLSLIRKSELNHYIKWLIDNKGHEPILNINAHAVNLAVEEKRLREYFNRTRVVFADGAGVVFGARILGYKIPERITYAEWMWELAEFSEHNRISLFLLGGKRGVAEMAAQNMSARFPGLVIAGAHHGYFDKQPLSEENQEVIKVINQSEPDILIIAFGMPTQERWLMENWDKIKSNVALTGGAVFDYVSGELKRAPRIFTDHGFEWFGRLLIQPKHLWKRYLIGNPLFLARVLMQKFQLRKY